MQERNAKGAAKAVDIYNNLRASKTSDGLECKQVGLRVCGLGFMAGGREKDRTGERCRAHKE